MATTSTAKITLTAEDRASRVIGQVKDQMSRAAGTAQELSAAAGLVGRGAVALAHLVRLEGPGPVVPQLACHLRAHGLAHGVHALRVDLGKLLGDVGLGRQGQRIAHNSSLSINLLVHFSVTPPGMTMTGSAGR